MTVSVDAAEANEGDEVSFVVKLSGEVSSDVEVSYATSDGTAGSAFDYTAVPATTLTFTAGQKEKTVTVATTEDDLNEADETFTVSLTVPNGVTLPDGVSLDADKDEALGTILDDDGQRHGDGERGWACHDCGGGTDGDVHGDGDRDEHGGGGGDLRGGHHGVDGDGAGRLHGAERDDGADDWRGCRDERDDRHSDEDRRSPTTTTQVLEPDETLVLKLTGVSTAGEASVTTASATATIEDTGAVTVSVDAAEGERGRRGELRGEAVWGGVE